MKLAKLTAIMAGFFFAFGLWLLIWQTNPFVCLAGLLMVATVIADLTYTLTVLAIRMSDAHRPVYRSGDVYPLHQAMRRVGDAARETVNR